MFTIRTSYNVTAVNGGGRITAKGHGKQRTTPWDHAKSRQQNHAAATGALLNVLADERQQAMLRHPSGAKRVKVEDQHDSSIIWTVKV